MKNKLIIPKTALFLFFIVLFIFGARVANAATLYLSPSSGNFSVGNIMTASVLVNTQGKAINNADAVINFPASLLDVISINKSGSIFSLWVEEPKFSNSAGMITFNGGLPTPGFNGAAGKIINIVFRVKSEGSASVIFSSATVRANDGYGTDVLTGTPQALFTFITEERFTPPAVETEIRDESQAPSIPTKPDSDKWYFNISEEKRDDLTDPRVKFIFNLSGKTLGIDYYEVQIDSGNVETWQDDGSGIFETPALSPGTHILVVKAVNKAGNFLANSITFIVEPLEVPSIVDYPKEAKQGDILTVKGTSYPDAEITIWLQKNDREPNIFTVRSDSAGDFVFIDDQGLETGVYKLWAMVTDNRGASSDPSEKLTFVAKQPAFVTIGTFAIGFLSILIPLLALIILLIILLWYSWHKFTTLRNRLRKEVREAERALHKAFDLLKEAIREQIKILEKAKTKRKLTEEEEKVIDQLKKDLDDAEKFVKKEIDDIEKVVK